MGWSCWSYNIDGELLETAVGLAANPMIAFESVVFVHVLLVVLVELGPVYSYC